MQQRFDEVDLVRVPGPEYETPAADHLPESPAISGHAPLLNRVLAFLTDISLFIAVALAMSPLLPLQADLVEAIATRPLAFSALAGFLLLLSLYYYVLSWMIWGRTVGASIFDLRVTADDGGPVDVKSALRRWAGTLAAIATLGIGFLPALAGTRRSMPDRLSRTRVCRSAID